VLAAVGRVRVERREVLPPAQESLPPLRGSLVVV